MTGVTDGRRASIDPRIRARRIAVQRDEGRKRLRRLSVVGIVVAVLAGLGGLTRSPLLDVDHVEVRGAAHTGGPATTAASGIHRGDGMVGLSLGGAARRVAALPWVETAEVNREWPGTVVIRVVERRPVAYVPATKGVVLVDRTGRELAAVDAPPAGLLRVDVPAVRPALGKQLPVAARSVLDLAGTLPATLADRVVALHAEKDGTVSGTVRLRNKATAAVLLGAPTQTDAKWLALATILDQADPVGLAQIDVRVPGAPALTRR